MILNRIVKDPRTEFTYQLDLSFSWRNRLDYRETVSQYILIYHSFYTDRSWWKGGRYDN